MNHEIQVLKRFVEIEKKPDLLVGSFPTQTSFIKDQSKLKAAQCDRRSGKSYGMGIYLFTEALENPGVSCLYIGLTRSSAKRVMFKDVFKVINRKFKLNAKFNEVELTVTFPNGSVIYCVGMDVSEKEQDKALGQKFKLVVIDECASFRNDLRKIVYATLMPAVADYDGTIAMIGTTSSLTIGLFFDVTTGVEPGWSVHKWNHKDNPYTAEKVEGQIQRLIEQNPAIIETPLFRQMYCNEWVVDEERLVYKYTRERNLIQNLPEIQFQYVLGVDLGYNDDTAFSLLAYNQHDPTLYIPKVYKKTKMDITDVADQIKYFASKYTPNQKIVVDGANKQAVEEIRRRHGIPLQAADKTGKRDFIEIMNSEFIQGKIKLVDSETTGLQDEYATLIWDDRSSKWVENSSCPNHLCDATLYAWRYCYSYLSRPVIDIPHPTSEKAVDEFWEKEQFKVQNEAEKPFWEQEY